VKSVVRVVSVAALIALGIVLVRGWAEQQLGSRARSEYFNQRRVYAPRMVQELGALPPELREASGLTVSRMQPGVLWSHNDSGDAPTLYAIDMKGRLLAKGGVVNAIAIDWEDIAAGPCPEDGAGAKACLYVADTGDNNQSRATVNIFVVPEPKIASADSGRTLVVNARSFRFRYPKEPEDTEAIAVLPNGDVTLVTKGRTSSISFFGFAKADVVRALMRGEVLTAVHEGDSGISPNQGLGRWVTAAAMSPDGTTLAVKTYSEIYFYAVENGPNGRRWRDLKRPCFLDDLEPQGEAIDFLDAKTLVLASETTFTRRGLLHRVQC
jgi:hypothetical protein